MARREGQHIADRTAPSQGHPQTHPDPGLLPQGLGDEIGKGLVEGGGHSDCGDQGGGTHRTLLQKNFILITIRPPQAAGFGERKREGGQGSICLTPVAKKSLAPGRSQGQKKAGRERPAFGFSLPLRKREEAVGISPQPPCSCLSPKRPRATSSPKSRQALISARVGLKRKQRPGAISWYFSPLSRSSTILTASPLQP